MTALLPFAQQQQQMEQPQAQHTVALACLVVLSATGTTLAAMAAAMAATMAAIRQQQGWVVVAASLSRMGQRLRQLLGVWSSCCGQTPGMLWP